MIHTMCITYNIISPKQYNEIYNSFGQVRKVDEGTYRIYDLKEKGIDIILSKKKVDSKYKYDYMQIKIILNPMKLIGGNDLEIFELCRIDELTFKFDNEIKKINESLPPIYRWVVNRIDYAINIETPNVEKYIELFKMSDIPKSFIESNNNYIQYDGSLYLSNNSVNINFYDKYKERCNKGFHMMKENNLLRLEVQCKKSKTDRLKVKYAFENKFLQNYINRGISQDTIKYYYNKIVGHGDYYKLDKVIQMINESNHTVKIKEKLINVVMEINDYKSVWKAREESRYSVHSFNRYLKQIRDLNINPVTIPEEWEVEKLVNPIKLVK